MDADWSVELGHDDPVLEFPWRNERGQLAYVDLKHHPERVGRLAEVSDCSELADFLTAVNSPASPLLTAKCDVWATSELNEAEQIYQAEIKFCSYVDLLFANEAERRSFENHETLVKSLTRALSESEGLSSSLSASAAEFIVRRCWFHLEFGASSPGSCAYENTADEPQPGYFVTFYQFGYGSEQEDARSQWVQGLRRVTSVLAQITA